MIEAIRLRPGTPDDLEAMFQLDVECFDETFRFSRAAMRRFAQASNRISILAETPAGELAGFAIASLHRKYEVAYVVTLDVALEARRQGLGSRLLRAVEEAAIEEGLSRIELHVYGENTAALELYQSLGYERGDEVEDYYAEGLHAVEMSKRLAGRTVNEEL